MFDFGNADESQKKAVTTTEGPLLILGGPGTGKTRAIRDRALYLMEEKKVSPYRVTVAVASARCAEALSAGIASELGKSGMLVNPRDLKIGTFSSLCLGIVRDHPAATALKKNFRVLDSFEARYAVYRSMERFRALEGIGLVVPASRKRWDAASEICRTADELDSENVSADALMGDGNPSIAALGRLLSEYHALLAGENAVDETGIQAECLRMLGNDTAVLRDVRAKTEYVMADDYQDTTYIQERILLLIGGERGNVCVAGDDDVALCRREGGTVRNLFDFPGKFAPGACETVRLERSRRLNASVAGFCSSWMGDTEGRGYAFEWNGCRSEKALLPRSGAPDGPAVYVLPEDGAPAGEAVLSLVRRLKDSGAVSDLGQIAYITACGSDRRSRETERFLRERGVPTYSRRGETYFRRSEVTGALGCLMLMFPGYADTLRSGGQKALSPALTEYYLDCLEAAEDLTEAPEGAALRALLRELAARHKELEGSTDYAFTGLLYRLFAVDPFRGMVAPAATGARTPEAEGLSALTRLIGEYESLYGIVALNGDVSGGRRRIDARAEALFNTYIRILFDEALPEGWDGFGCDPEGCVQFLSAREARGMEFPVVIAGSLSASPEKAYEDIMTVVEERYFPRPAFEPYGDIKYHDFWRANYAAFSRAEGLLILDGGDGVGPCFAGLCAALPQASDLKAGPLGLPKKAPEAEGREVISIEDALETYERCTLMHGFFSKSGFAPSRGHADMEETLVRQTIDDVHRAVLRGEKASVTRANVERWFDRDYETLSAAWHTQLGATQRKEALSHALIYAETQSGIWASVKAVGMSVMLICPDYALEGKADVFAGEDGTLEIVDFRTERKPNIIRDRELIENRSRLLHLYAYLVERRTGRDVSRVSFYYMNVESGDPLLSFPHTATDGEDAAWYFDRVARRMLKGETLSDARDAKACARCDFRFHCGKSKP